MSPALVGVVMGSSSDLATMSGAREELERLGISHEVRVVSAHRNPTGMLEYGKDAADRGLRVIIAGAGGAAHLPGMLAAVTDLPVIGVPVAATSLDGWDALLSIAQMPTGVPVATMAVGGAANAALLAARILALGDPELAERVTADRARRRAASLEQDRTVREATENGDDAGSEGRR